MLTSVNLSRCFREIASKTAVYVYGMGFLRQLLVFSRIRTKHDYSCF